MKNTGLCLCIYEQQPFLFLFVAGMVNNYQRNAGTEDDRDSASLSLITSLDVGDQVQKAQKVSVIL